MISVRPSSASDATNDRATLKGIDLVKVACDIRPEDELFGITRGQLLTDVELQLRKAGIKVGESKTASFLYVNVNVKDSGVGTYAVALEISFRQAVSLDRAPATKNMVPTWGIYPVVLTTTHARYSEFCRQYLRDLVDQFANAFLSVNPK